MGEPYIRKMTEADKERVLKIYESEINKRKATFETKVPSWEVWDKRHLKACRLVACVDEEVVGWVALSPVSTREAYKGVAEVSIYVDGKHQGKGIGSLLMSTLIQMSEEEGFWTLQANIFPTNIESLKLHEKFGFKIVGVRNKIAKLDGVWKDIVLLERRSEKW